MRWGTGRKAWHGTYGAMMTLDLVMGNCLPSTVAGTFSRNPSSWRDKTSGLPSYQLPAWVASRVPCCGIADGVCWCDILLCNVCMCLSAERQAVLWKRSNGR